MAINSTKNNKAGKGKWGYLGVAILTYQSGFFKETEPTGNRYRYTHYIYIFIYKYIMYNKKLKLAHVLIQVKQSQDLQPAN